MLTVDIALISFYYPTTICLLFQVQHRGVAVNFGTASSSTFGQGLSQISCLNITIIRVLDRTDNAVDIGHWPCFFNLFWGQEIHFHTDGLSNARVISILVHAIFGSGQANIRYHTKAYILPGLFF